MNDEGRKGNTLSLNYRNPAAALFTVHGIYCEACGRVGACGGSRSEAQDAFWADGWRMEKMTVLCGACSRLR
jgi:hypothetical protein